MANYKNKQVEIYLLALSAAVWGAVVGIAFRLLAEYHILEPIKINQIIFWL